MGNNTNETVFNKLNTLVGEKEGDVAIIWIEPKTGHHDNYNTILNNDKQVAPFYWINDKDNEDASSFLKKFSDIELSEAKIFLENGVIHLLQVDNEVKIHEFDESEKTFARKEETATFIKIKKSRESDKSSVNLITYYDKDSNPIMFRILPSDKTSK
jgi:hypothetical protein